MATRQGLKVRVVEAKLKLEDKKNWKLSFFKKGYQISIGIVDLKGVQIGQNFATRPVNDPVPLWDQIAIFAIPPNVNDFSNNFLRVGFWEDGKLMGHCPLFSLAKLPREGAVDGWHIVDGKGHQIHLKIGWCMLRENVAHPRRRLSLQKIQPTSTSSQDQSNSEGPSTTPQAQSNLVQELQDKLSMALEEIEKQKNQNSKFVEALKKYRDIDDDARELLGAAIDWAQIRNTAKQLEQQPQAGAQSPLIKNLNLSEAGPRDCAALLTSDQELVNLSFFYDKLKKSDATWLKLFLEGNGLENIFLLLKGIEEQEISSQLSLQAVQLGGCIKAILNTQASCEYAIHQHQQTMQDIISVVARSKNTLLKSQMFNLFAALCIYGSASHEIVVSGLKVTKDNTQLFHGLVSVMKEEKDRELITSTMALINGIILGEKDLEARMKLRMIFTNSDLLGCFTLLKDKLSSEVVLMTQFRVFEDMSKKDDIEFKDLRYIGNMDLQNPRSVFNQVLVNADMLGVEDLFLRHLQNLLLIPHGATDDPLGTWRFVEFASRRVTSKFSHFSQNGPLTLSQINSEVFRLLALEKAIKMKKKEEPQTQNLVRRNTGWKKAVTSSEKEIAEFGQVKRGDFNGKPQMGYLYNYEYGTLEEYSEDGKVVSSIPEPPIMVQKNQKISFHEGGGVPEPQRKMKGLFWNFMDGSNVSSYWDDIVVPPLDELSDMFQELQELFYVPKEKEKKKKTTLLPLHTANNISILRAQFNMKDEEILENIFDIEKTSSLVETHHFEALLNCIPSEDQLVPLRAYKGPVSELAPVDRFTLMLVSVPQISEKLRAFIYWDEFQTRISTIDNALAAMKKACDQILQSHKLKHVLGIVLSIGNFLNSGTNRGNAKGFRPKSFEKLTDIRSTKSKEFSLLNYIAGFIDANFKHLLKFTDEISALEEAMRFEPSQIEAEIAKLEDGLQEILFCLETKNTQENESNPLFYQFYDAISTFSQYASVELDRVVLEWSAFSESAASVLTSFGETPQSSPIKELWGHFYSFCKKFKEVLEEQQHKDLETQRLKRIQEFWQREGNTKSIKDIEGDSRKVVEDPQVVLGIMDKLISSIKNGQFFL